MWSQPEPSVSGLLSSERCGLVSGVPPRERRSERADPTSASRLHGVWLDFSAPVNRSASCLKSSLLPSSPILSGRPMNPGALQNWLILGWSVDDPKVALEFHQEALVLWPDDPVILDSIARARERIQRPQYMGETSKDSQDSARIRQSRFCCSHAQRVLASCAGRVDNLATTFWRPVG
jgi:hypothetical protein